MEASHVFAAQVLDTLPEPEIAEIQQRQIQMSAALQKASSSLSALNEFSAVKWVDLHPKFEAHTKQIKDLQHDLDHIFRTIRSNWFIHSWKSVQYPRSIKTKLHLPSRDTEEEEDNDGNGIGGDSDGAEEQDVQQQERDSRQGFTTEQEIAEE